ncbi:PAP2 superfamily protein [Metarhizium brunneum]
MPSSGTVFSYTVDWAILIGLAVAGFIAGEFPPNKWPFSLHNPDISLPYKGHDTVSLGAAAAVSVVVPAILMLCFALASLVALKASDKKNRCSLRQKCLVYTHEQ